MDNIRSTQLEGKLTLEYAMTGRSLSFYRAQEGPYPVMAELAKGISAVANAYNIGKNLSDSQVVDIAEGILAECPTLKLAEFVYFINRAKLGKYGKAFDRLDMPTVFEWLDKFFQEREELLERKRFDQKNAYEVSEVAAGNLLAKLAEKEPDSVKILNKPTEDRERKEMEYEMYKWERKQKEKQLKAEQQAETTDP